MEQTNFVKYLNNKMSHEELSEFEDWLRTSSDNLEEFNEFKTFWEGLDSYNVNQPDVNTEWMELHRRISDSKREQKIHPLSSHKLQKRDRTTQYYANHNAAFSIFLKIAAVLVLFLPFYMLMKDFSPREKTDRPEVIKNVVYEKITKRGERATLTFADGSIIYLHSGSKLKYPKYFDKDQRVVELEGEAYFSIGKDPTRPFLVKTGNTITEVLGTEFNIKDRNENIELVVLKGIVATYTEKCTQKNKLNKGDYISYSKEKGFSKIKKVNGENYVGWRKNKMIFNNQPFREVMEEVERYYDVDAKYENLSHRNRKVNGAFDASSLDEVLYSLSLALNIKIERKGSQVIVK